MKILFVDDDPDQLRTGMAVLSRKKEWKVKMAWDGDEALEEFLAFAPDVIITDTQMRMMNGPELIQRAKKIDPTVRAILVSGLSTVKKLAGECGADASFQKPFSWPEMLALITSWEK